MSSRHDFSQPRLRFLVGTFLFGVLLILTASVILVVVPQVGFTHLACKMEEDALGGSLSCARTMVRDLQISSDILKTDNTGDLNINVPALRDHLQTQFKDNPEILYTMIVSQAGRILVHTYGTQEGRAAWGDTVTVSSPQDSFVAFPDGRFGFKEFVYETIVPFNTGNWRGLALVIGLSKKRIEAHIDEVRREMVFRMASAAGLGVIALSVPIIGLLYVLRRYRTLVRQSRQVTHLAQMGNVARGLVHEIRNPLNSVRFNIKIIEEELDRLAPPENRESIRQLIDRSDREIGRVDEMLTEYLNYARPAPLQATLQDLNTVAAEVLALFEFECRRNKITLSGDFAANLPKLLIDEKQIRQVILNIILNAQQALHSTGGNIQMRTFARGDMVFLEVEDDGPGIPEEDREKIFEPFFSKRDGGTGLGLSIAKRLMENHGGFLQCRGRVGRGIVFCMTFGTRQDRFQQGSTRIS